jgi:hypothetical protein
MSIYIHKNNQQLGPFEESKVLEMLRNGEVSPNDMAIRQGETEWRKLGDYYPDAGSTAPAPAPVAAAQPAPNAPDQAAPVAAAQPAQKKSKKGLLLGCAAFFVIALLIAAVLGFLAYRNLNPADSTEDLPNSVSDMKLDTRYPPKGDVWGTKTEYVGIYSNSSKTDSVLYMMTVYADETTAKDEFRKELADSCKTGETPMYFSFVDKNGVDVSQGATCAVPLYVQKGNKLAAIGGSGADVDTFIEFAENLPFNKGTTMKKKGE